MSKPNPYEPFFAYARERYRIFLRRERELEPLGDEGKWTTDPILQQYRFCNVFREDDKVTRWIREHVHHAGYGDRVLQALIIARWFNRIETLEKLLPPEDCKEPYFYHNMLFIWNSKIVRKRLKEHHPLVTGAYMVKTPPRMNKLEGLIWCIEHVVGERGMSGVVPWACKHKAKSLLKNGGTLQETTEWLQRFPYLGSFMAYEVVTDLRHTPLLENAPDIMTWASPGPGAARGLGRLIFNNPKHFNYHRKRDAAEMQTWMRVLLTNSQNGLLWPVEWPSWEMREVEHTLCEFDKYERARLGEGKPKQRFNGGA